MNFKVPRALPKTFMSCALALSLTACATQPTRFVTETVADDCSRTRTVTETNEMGIVTSQKTEDTQSHVGRCGGEREVAIVAENYSDMLKKSAETDFRIMAIGVQKELESGTSASEYTKRYLSAIDDKRPGYKEAALHELKALQIRPEDLNRHIAITFINAQVNAVRGRDNSINFPTVAILNSIYHEDKLPKDQRRFPDIETKFLRRAIDKALDQTGENLNSLNRRYTRNLELGSQCAKTANENGFTRKGCTGEKGLENYTPIPGE